MDKINVLWIEDNPLQESLFVKDLVSRDSSLENVFSNELNDYPVPAIHFDEALEGYERYFNLQVLQHPIEIKDFVSMCLLLQDTKGVNVFNELEGVLPEVIAFDYHFGAKITVNQGAGAMSYNPKTISLREFINPNYKFIKSNKFGNLFKEREFILEKEESENYTQNDFLMEISKVKEYAEIKKKDKEDLIEDDFGLFAAVEILRIFREHPTVAIPATYNKNEVEKLTLHGKYFEWLNEYEYSIDFKREDRGSKKWDSILKDAAVALRKKIESHSKLGKITLDLSELLILSSGEIPKVEPERGFTIVSVYGKKQLPLDGLFIDVQEDRDNAIQKWVKGIFKEAFQNSHSRVDLNLIGDAKKHAETLWGAFQSKRFWDRMNFSKLHKLIKKNSNTELTEEEKGKYDDYIRGKVEGFKLTSTSNNSGGFTYEYQNAIELKGIIKKQTTKYDDKDKSMLSLTMLFTILKLFKARMDYLKANDEVVDHIFPTENEIMTVLFPLASTPEILPVHRPKDTPKSYLNDIFVLGKNESAKAFDELMSADEKFFDEPTKYLLRCYAESIGLNDNNYHPRWLKTRL